MTRFYGVQYLTTPYVDFSAILPCREHPILSINRLSASADLRLHRQALFGKRLKNCPWGSSLGPYFYGLWQYNIPFQPQDNFVLIGSCFWEPL